MGQYIKIDRAYDFLTTHQDFDLSELIEASGWSLKSTKSNISKKLKECILTAVQNYNNPKEDKT